MTEPRALSGIVLAGGRSSRMGRDKALLEIEGESLVARAAQLLSGFCDEVLIASGDGRRLPEIGLPQVPDAVPNAGPLGGIVAGLQAAAFDPVAVVAVDMPFASRPVFEVLLSLWTDEDAVVPVTEGGPEPLHAVYAKQAAGPLGRELEAGRYTIRAALDRLTVRLVDEPEWRSADPSGTFARNVNTPSDMP